MRPMLAPVRQGTADSVGNVRNQELSHIVYDVYS